MLCTHSCFLALCEIVVQEISERLLALLVAALAVKRVLYIAL